MFRGNIVMKGYLKNRKATDEALAGGWFHSGDLGVMHPDGYIQLKDRSKDIIISGGENISSIEVEDALYKHPAVASCGVVARHDEKWGEMPVAYVELKPGKTATEAEIIEHCRKLLARFKVPEGGDFRRDPENLDRQDPEVPAARDGQAASHRPEFIAITGICDQGAGRFPTARARIAVSPPAKDHVGGKTADGIIGARLEDAAATSERGGCDAILAIIAAMRSARRLEDKADRRRAARSGRGRSAESQPGISQARPTARAAGRHDSRLPSDRRWRNGRRGGASSRHDARRQRRPAR